MRRWWPAGLAGVVVLVAGVVWLVWPSPPPQRARPYLAFTACLLTDARGVVGVDAAPVWAGLEDASLATRAKVQFLQVTSGSTVADAQPFLASLVQRQCAVVVAVGAPQVGAAVAGAAKYPDVRFVLVGAGGASGGNVTWVDGGPAQVRARVAQVVEADVAAAHQ